MPAAAVIPAPIAYIKVVAVKKLVVGSRERAWRCRPACFAQPASRHCPSPPPCSPVGPGCPSPGVPAPAGAFTLRKLECSRQARQWPLNIYAWNNGIGPRVPFCWPLDREVMIKRDGRGHPYRGVRGEILGSSRDEQQRKHLPRTFSLIKNESQRFEDDQIPS